MRGAAESERQPEASLGQFLLSQATRAGLSARDIAERFQKLANEEALRIEDGADAPSDPISEMSFSKSHLDRLYKGSASLPSRRFLTIFLGITSQAAGIRPELHHELHRRADELLALERRNHRQRRSQTSTPTSQESTEIVVATLQIQLELERAHRTEDRLRWALSDTQRVMETLLRIINALRDIITGSAAEIGLHTAKESEVQALAKRQRIQAKSYKATAEAQFDRANERRQLLETLWDQAHENLQRLTFHAEVSDAPPLSTELALPRIPLPEDLRTKSTLMDIGAALGKVEKYNDAEEQAVIELQHSIAADTPLNLDDELNILVAATRLTDEGTRRTALRTLLEQWPHHRKTRDTLVRLARDEKSEIRRITAWSLAEGWSGDPIARDALTALARDNDASVRENAVLGLAEGWAGDPIARDALTALARDNDGSVRENAVLGLAEGWAGDPTVRDALTAFIYDADVYVRMAVAESLADVWLNDAIADAALQTLSSDASPSVRWAAQQTIVTQAGRHDDTPQKIGLNANILLAVRLPSDHDLPAPIPLLDRLHRGIAFDAGITVLIGDNGAGKTVLLHTLMQLSPHRTTDASEFRNPSDLSRSLARALKVAWNEQRPIECAHYLTDYYFRHNRGKSKASGIEHWSENWSALMRSRQGSNQLFLFDEPAALYSPAVHKIMREKLNELASQGNQVIIASTQSSWIEHSTARVIRIDKHKLHKRRY
ncbi:HEAT repeat domain-containing protein [Streptomyces sp. NPDC005483]|uniref:HEAT repeat domain-containing protein n=1 Tax=Streptomyces sp. NPDC005483 TaxID=3154882 RepID=UPI0033B08C45